MRLCRNKRVYAVCQVRRAIALGCRLRALARLGFSREVIAGSGKSAGVIPFRRVYPRAEVSPNCIAVRSSGWKLGIIKIGFNLRTPVFYCLDVCSDAD